MNGGQPAPSVYEGRCITSVVVPFGKQIVEADGLASQQPIQCSEIQAIGALWREVKRARLESRNRRRRFRPDVSTRSLCHRTAARRTKSSRLVFCSETINAR